VTRYPEILTVGEVAEMHGCSTAGARRALQQGRLRGRKVGRDWAILARDAGAWVPRGYTRGDDMECDAFDRDDQRRRVGMMLRHDSGRTTEIDTVDEARELLGSGYSVLVGTALADGSPSHDLWLYASAEAAAGDEAGHDVLGVVEGVPSDTPADEHVG
jgi:hypothetical protein